MKYKYIVHQIPSVSNKSRGEKTFTFVCFFNPLSPEKIGQLYANASARYGESFIFSCIASTNLSRKVEKGMNSIWSVRSEIRISRHNIQYGGLVIDGEQAEFVYIFAKEFFDKTKNVLKS